MEIHFFPKFSYFIDDICSIPFTFKFDFKHKIKEFMLNCLAENLICKCSVLRRPLCNYLICISPGMKIKYLFILIYTYIYILHQPYIVEIAKFFDFIAFNK